MTTPTTPEQAEALAEELDYHYQEFKDALRSLATQLRAAQAVVNRKDPWALSDTDFIGSSCRMEREVRWFAACGIAGKLFEPKEQP